MAAFVEIPREATSAHVLVVGLQENIATKVNEIFKGQAEIVSQKRICMPIVFVSK